MSYTKTKYFIYGGTHAIVITNTLINRNPSANPATKHPPINFLTRCPVVIYPSKQVRPELWKVEIIYENVFAQECETFDWSRCLSVLSQNTSSNFFVLRCSNTEKGERPIDLGLES
jgi:hypothetical protein